MRAPDAVSAADLAEFAEYLLEVGEGRHVVDPRFGEDCIKLPRDIVIDNPAYDPQMEGDEGEDEVPVSLGLKRIIDAMYGEEDLNNPAIATDEYFANRTILAPTNAAIQSVNEAVAQRLQGVTQVYLSTDSIDDDTAEASSFFETEVLNSLRVNGIPPHKLLLKKGAPIMMIRNLNPAGGLCNGTRLRVVELKTHVIRAIIMAGSHHGKEVLIPRIIFISNNDIKDFPFRLRRIQFPVVPAFAMTINKAQGQTVHNMGLYLPTPCFSHGQLYVALSRVTSKAKLKVLIDHAEDEGDDALYTNNIVYHEIFE
jgi:ATP-dependent exoDNAse (exonuclease V) alpha subunit